MKVNKKSNDFTSFDIALSKDIEKINSSIDEATSTKYDVIHIPLEDIIFNPINTRFNEEDTDETIQELADNIQDRDLLTPIIVIPYADNKYMLVSGERRTKAFKMLNRRTIPAMIRQVSDDLEVMEMLYEANLQSRILTPKTRFLAFRDLYREYQKRAKTINTSAMAKKLQLSAKTVKKYRMLLEKAEDGDIELLNCDEITMDEFIDRTMRIIANKEKNILTRRIELISQGTEDIQPIKYKDSAKNTVYSVERDEAGKYCFAVTDVNLFKVPLHYQNQVYESFENAQVALDMFAMSNDYEVYNGDFSEYQRHDFSHLPYSDTSDEGSSNATAESEVKIDEKDFGPSIFETTPTQKIGTSDDEEEDSSFENVSVNEQNGIEGNANEDNSENITDDEVDKPDEPDTESSRKNTEDVSTTEDPAVKEDATPIKTEQNSNGDYLKQYATFSGKGLEDNRIYEGALVYSSTGRAFIIIKLSIDDSVQIGSATRKTNALFVEVEPKSVIRHEII